MSKSFTFLSPEDFENIDLKGFRLEWPNDPGLIGYVDIIGDDNHGSVVRAWVEKRPSYCDRGRFGFNVESSATEHGFTIDGADLMPRYFFSLQRCIDELRDWYDFNYEKLNKATESEKEYAKRKRKA